MRVTNSMLAGTLMRNLNVNLNRLDKLQNQISTGRKFANISDDPVALVYSQAARNKIARLSHYQRSVGTAQDWLNQAELGVMELQKTITNALEDAVNAATDVKTNDDRKNIAAAMAQFRNHYIDTLNTTFGDKYVFGGYNTPGEPEGSRLTDGMKAFTFDIDPLTGEGALFYNGFNLTTFDGMLAEDYDSIVLADTYADVPAALRARLEADFGWATTGETFDMFKTLHSNVLTFDVGPGVSMPVTMNGIEVVLIRTTDVDADGNMINVIRSSANILHDLFVLAENENDDIENVVLKISDMIKPIQDAQNHLLTKTAEIGGRVRRLELLEARYEQDMINYERMKSNAEDVDMAEVIILQKMAEAVYQAALSSGARIIQPTLMDFLR